MATYKPYKKTESGKEEVKVPSSAISGLATVATSGSYNDLSDKPTIPDVSGKANIEGGNTFKGTQTLTEASSGGYSINASGYVKGSWLQSSITQNKGSNTGKVCVFDNAGWVYYRTPAEILSEAGGAKSSDIPDTSKMVTTDTEQFITGRKYFHNHPVDFIDGSSVRVGNTVHLYDTGILLDVEDMDPCPIQIGLDQDAGTSGQVLTSQGAGKTPKWTTPSTGATDAVKYTAQTLTTAQKTQARSNIGAGAGNGTVKSVKINGSTKSPNSAGLVDLGTISGGGGTTVESVYMLNDNSYELCDLSSRIGYTSFKPAMFHCVGQDDVEGIVKRSSIQVGIYRAATRTHENIVSFALNEVEGITLMDVTIALRNNEVYMSVQYRDDSQGTYEYGTFMTKGENTKSIAQGDFLFMGYDVDTIGSCGFLCTITSNIGE